MINAIIQKLNNKKDLTCKEARDLIDFFEEGTATDIQISSFLTLLKAKGETSEEITGFASRMREKALKIDTEGLGTIVDSCGTGGDCTNTFNISTASAILGSASGLNVAKHSNGGFSSKCGSSNVLEALNINLVKTPEEVRKILNKNNIAFIHAPYFHKCTASVNAVRKKMGIRTVFNIIGPLTNPACPTGQVLGVPSEELCPKMIEALKNLDCKRALVVSGQNPTLDEISICGKTIIYRLENGKIDNFELYPEDLGLKRAKIEDICGDTPETNAKIIRNIFECKIKDSRLDAVVINTAALLWTGNKVNSLEEGVKLAYELIQSGAAQKKLKELCEII